MRPAVFLLAALAIGWGVLARDSALNQERALEALYGNTTTTNPNR